jgi:hypothetical protein
VEDTGSVRAFVNQHSYLLVVIVVGAVGWFVTGRLRGRTRWIALIALAVLVVATGASLRNPGSVASPTAFDRTIGHGKPVALEFYSNF